MSFIQVCFISFVRPSIRLSFLLFYVLPRNSEFLPLGNIPFFHLPPFVSIRPSASSKIDFPRRLQYNLYDTKVAIRYSLWHRAASTVSWFWFALPFSTCNRTPLTMVMKRPLLLATLLAGTAFADSSTCERLKATLTYTQEEAPRDLSSVVSRKQ